MNWWMLAPTGLLLGWITVQDFRERQVSLAGLVMLFILGLFYSCLALQWMELIRRVAFNSLFAGIILVSGTLLVKLRRPGDSVSSFIGSGDFLFLLSISPLFAFGAFLVFLNTSMMVVLVVFGVLLASGRTNSSGTIPLAGALALCLMAFCVIDLIVDVELLETADWIYSLSR